VFAGKSGSGSGFSSPASVFRFKYCASNAQYKIVYVLAKLLIEVVFKELHIKIKSTSLRRNLSA
jgi:hypothetical protein